MDRLTVLECIERHLRARSSQSGDARPLGELVVPVADELRTNRTTANSQASIVPVQTVAAFVDGTATPAEEQLVCQAILVDNSVLAELLASVRAKQESHKGIDSPLVGRLEDLVGQHFANHEKTTFNAEAETNQSHSASRLETVALAPDKEHAHSTSAYSQQKWGQSIVAGVFAASICFLLVAWLVATRLIAPDGSQLTTQPNTPQDQRQFPDPDSIVEAQPTDSALPSQAPMIDDLIVEQNASRETRDDKIPEQLPKYDDTRVTDHIVQSADHKDGDREPDKQSPRDDKSFLVDLEWSEINGLLAQKIVLAPTSENNSSNESSGWARVLERQPLLDGNNSKQTILQTLPWSRAQCSIINKENNGRLILGPDSSLTLGSKAIAPSVIQLDFGAVVFDKIPAGSEIGLANFRSRVVEISWLTEGTLVAHYGPKGFQLNVRSGSVQIGDQQYSEESVVLASSRLKSTESDLTLPRWVDGQRSEMPRHILAQFDASANVTLAIQQSFADLTQRPPSTRDQSTLAGLAKLQSALAGDQLLRMLGSRNEILRAAAINRLVSIPEWDPRYESVWGGTQRQDVGQARLKQFVALAQQGKLTRTHAPQLLRGMSAPDAPSRVLYYFLLRSVVRSGPSYDANWTRPQRARAVAAWEKHLGIR